jgi:hypothetical protein
MGAERLAELNRVAQIGLEAHRVDPEDEQTWEDYQKAVAERDAAWTEHILEKHDASLNQGGTA